MEKNKQDAGAVLRNQDGREVAEPEEVPGPAAPRLAPVDPARRARSIEALRGKIAEEEGVVSSLEAVERVRAGTVRDQLMAARVTLASSQLRLRVTQDPDRDLALQQRIVDRIREICGPVMQCTSGPLPLDVVEAVVEAAAVAAGVTALLGASAVTGDSPEGAGACHLGETLGIAIFKQSVRLRQAAESALAEEGAHRQMAEEGTGG